MIDKLKQLTKDLGPPMTLCAITSFVLATWLVYTVVFGLAPLGLSPLGGAFSSLGWAGSPSSEVVTTLYLAIANVVLLALCITARKWKALLLAEASTVFCSVPYFITMSVFNFIVLPVLLVVLILLVREKKTDYLPILRALIPLPYLIWMFSLPVYMISL